MLRWLHLLIAEGHRAYPAPPRPELGLAWGPDGRRIDIQAWVGPEEVLDSDAEYGSGAEYSSETEYASEAEYASEVEYASGAEHGGGAEHEQSGGVEGEAAKGFEGLEGERSSGGASGGGAASERDASAGVRAEEAQDGDATSIEEVAEPRAGEGLASEPAERMEGPETTDPGVNTSGEADGASGSMRGELGAAAAAHPVGSAADREAGTLQEADQEARAGPGEESHTDSAGNLPLGKPENRN